MGLLGVRRPGVRRLGVRRRPDRTGVAVITGAGALAVLAVAVYVARRAWLGPWLSGHLTDTVFVFLLVLLVAAAGLVLVADRRVAHVVAALALVGAVGFEVHQDSLPGQAFDPVDAVLAAVSAGLALVVALWLERDHLEPTPAGRGRAG